MIVTILGGSAQSTPWLLDWLGKRVAERALTVRLVARDLQRLAAVSRACRLLASGSTIEIQEFGPDRWPESLKDADVVLIQLRIGGYTARAHDESFPLAYGIPGDEGLGPGGLAAAIRTWPHIRHVLAMVRHFAPDAIPLLLTSPAGLLVRLAALEYPAWKVYGICELPFTTLRRICRSAGCETDQATFSYYGVNHLGWFYDVRCAGQDILPAYLRATDDAMSEIAEHWQAVPLKYFRHHFYKEKVVGEQLSAEERLPRSRQLMNLQARALACFTSGQAADIRRVLAERVADWYTEAVGPFLLELMTPSEVIRPFFLTAFEEDHRSVRERPYGVIKGRFVPFTSDPPPESVRRLTALFLRYENQAAEAIFEGRGLERALQMHPWVEDTAQATNLVNEISRYPVGDQTWKCLN